MSFSICTVGCGWHARGAHGPAYRKYAGLHPDVALAACCDADAEKAQAFRRDFGFRACYTDVAEMLEREKPDAVCLTVPVHLTFELAASIMEAGYPLLLEKPPGLTKTDVLRLAEIAESRGIPHMVAFNRRFAPLVRRLKSELATLPREDIRHIRYELYRVARTDPDFSTTAIHAIDAVRFIADADYREIRFAYERLPQVGEGVANAVLEGAMTTGATFHIELRPISGRLLERAAVHLTDRIYRLRLPLADDCDFPGKLACSRDGRVVFELNGDETDDSSDNFGFYEENRLFFDTIRAAGRPAADLSSSVQSVEIAECLRGGRLRYKTE